MRPDLDDLRRAAPAADEAQGGLPLARAIGTRNLIIIIVTMPLVFIFVVLGVIAIAGDPGKRGTRAAGAPETLAQPAAYRGAVEPLQTALPPAAAPLLLSEGERIGAMALDGDRLAIRIEDDGGGEIVIYDLAAGAPLQTIPVRNGAPDEDGL